MTEIHPTPDATRRVQAHARRGLRWPVRVSAIDPEIDPATGSPCYTSIEESSVNLSEGGVFVPTTDTLTPGRRVLIEVDLPGGRIVQALGTVAWRRAPHAARSGDRPAGMGIEFTGMPHSSAMALAEALEPRRRARKRGTDRRGHYAHG
jgi:uncharacterized protein (TIGR02266 family)